MSKRRPGTIRALTPAERETRTRTFIAELAGGATEADAARSAGTSTVAVRRWREEDEDFDRAWEAAVADGRDLYEDGVAANAWDNRSED